LVIVDASREKVLLVLDRARLVGTMPPANGKEAVENLLGIVRILHAIAGLWLTYAHADKCRVVKDVGDDVQGKPARSASGSWGSAGMRRLLARRDLE
jgi:hypothetical protein